MDNLRIEEWQSDHPHWAEVAALIEALEQTDWVGFRAEWHLSSHLLVANTPTQIVGFLRYVVQEMGVEQDLPPFKLNDRVLTEGKVIAFGVAPDARRQGIGRALQAQLIQDCRGKNCYQIRSHSGEQNRANHQLKLAMGFAIHSLSGDQGQDGAFFLLPLGLCAQ